MNLFGWIIIICVIFNSRSNGNNYLSSFAESVCHLSTDNESSSLIVEVSCANHLIVKSALRDDNINISLNEADLFCPRLTNQINVASGLSLINYHYVLTSIVDLMLYWKRDRGAFLIDNYSGLHERNTLEYLKKRQIDSIIIPLTLNSELEEVIIESLDYQNIVIICHLELLNLIIEKAKSQNLFIQNYTWLIVNDETPKPLIGIDIPPNSQVTLVLPQDMRNNPTLKNIYKKPAINNDINNKCETKSTSLVSLTEANVYLRQQDKNAILLKTSPKASMYDIFFSPSSMRTECIRFAHWDVIRKNRLIQLETFNPKDKLRLRERRVRVVVFQHLPYSILTYPNGTLNVDGYLKKMIETLLINFNLRFTINEIPAVFGIGINGSYTGMVRMFFNREADLAMNILAMTNSRATGVRYAGPVTKAHLSITYHRPPAVIPPTTYLMPFNLQVWLTILGLLTVIIVSTFITLTASPSSNDNRHPCYSLSQQFHRKKFRVLTLTYFDEVMEYPLGGAAKVIQLTLLLSTLAVFIHYTSTFTAFLTYQEEKIPFKSIEDVVANKDYFVITTKNSRHQDMLQFAPPGPYLDIWKRIVKQGESSFSQTFEGGYYYMCRLPKSVLLSDGPTNIYLSVSTCGIAFAPVKYLQEYYNTPHRRDFPYSRMFTMGLIKVLERGILKKLTVEYRLESRPPCNPENANASFGISQVMGLFVVHACGIVLSLLALLIECLLPKRLPTLALKENRT